MKNLLLFVDNIEEAINLQTEMLKEIFKDFLHKNNHYRFKDDFELYVDGLNVIVNDSYFDKAPISQIKQYSNQFKSIHLIIDCHLDKKDQKETVHYFINELVRALNPKELEKYIFTVVTSYYHTEEKRKLLIDKIDDKIRDRIVFCYRPMYTNSNEEQMWDQDESCFGQYEIGNRLYDMYKDSEKVYITIEDLLFSELAIKNYAGMLLVRFFISLQ